MKRDKPITIESHFSMKQTTADEVCKLICSLDNSSSAGISKIPVKVLKFCSAELSPILSSIINQCINSGTIPNEWKFAIVRPLFKGKGNCDSFDNYRSISTLPPVGKIFERILSIRILFQQFIYNEMAIFYQNNESKRSRIMYLNPNKYIYVLNPNNHICLNERSSFTLLVLIITAANNFQKRLLIRNTWAISDSNIKFVFLLGLTNDLIIESKIQMEFMAFDDIVQANFVDSYTNLTLKTIVGMKWAAIYCSNSKFILKIDDDMVLNANPLLNYLEQIQNKYTKNTIFGMVYKNAPVCRDKSSKFYVDKKDFEKDFYPDYLDGEAYLFTSDLAQKFYSASLNVKNFVFEYVYIGLLTAKLNVTQKDISNKYLLTNEFNKDDNISQFYFILAKNVDFYLNVWKNIS